MRQRPARNPSTGRAVAATVCGIAAGIAAAGVVLHRNGGQLITPIMVSARECDIKGNISQNSHEKIFHLPGQENYADTIIRPEYGERWFCAEAEALAAGWRKSRN